MIECLKQLKERESAYKENVDNANSFLHGEFRQSIQRLITQLMPKVAKSEMQSPENLSLDRSSSNQSNTLEQSSVDLGIEGVRCEAVHEAINKFVVYEKFAEMTHKYDVQQFTKILDEYNTIDELQAIRRHLDLEDPQESDVQQ